MDVKQILDNIHQLSNSDDAGQHGLRRALLREARKLFFALETPAEAILRIAWVQNATQATVRVATHLNIFGHISNGPKTSTELSRDTGAERSLIIRLLNQLSAVGVVAQPQADVYARTPLSEALVDHVNSSAVPAMAAAMTRALQATPDYFKVNGYRDPTDGMNCPFQSALDTKLSFFEFLNVNPEAGTLFNTHMMGYARARGAHWADFYPVEKRLAPNLTADESATLLVDMGGGLGQDILGFRKRFPGLAGRLVVQDLGSVARDWAADRGVKDERIEFAEHDFFVAQPIQGARAYYMHSILHDWPNPRCLDILAALKPALKPGYSRVLIHENVIPTDPENIHEVPTSLDWILMASFAARERTEQEWRELLESAGFKIEGIWTGHIGGESIIEATPFEENLC